jgi:katanin p60 ATPase-containing subunit A1
MIGYSGSDIKLVCKEAAMKPLRRLIAEMEKNEGNPGFKNYYNDSKFKILEIPEPITMIDFKEALEVTKSSNVIDLKNYSKWEKDFGSS